MLVREYASTLRGREREAQSAFHRLDASQGSTLTFFRKLAIIHSSLSYRLGGIVPSLSCAKRRQADDKTGLLMNDICHPIHIPSTYHLPPCLSYEYPPSALSVLQRSFLIHTRPLLGYLDFAEDYIPYLSCLLDPDRGPRASEVQGPASYFYLVARSERLEVQRNVVLEEGLPAKVDTVPSVGRASHCAIATRFARGEAHFPLTAEQSEQNKKPTQPAGLVLAAGRRLRL